MEDINIAKLSKKEIIEHVECLECFDDYLFKMKDNYHEFFISLQDILTCLWLAEEKGVLPPINSEWYLNVLKQCL